MRKLLLLIPLLLIFAVVLHAQTAEQGAVLGVVTDQSGAVIPGAKVTVRNLDTGFEKEDSTDGSGNFQILALPIGPYSVEVSMTGFKSWKMDRIVLEIGQRSRLSPVLTLGGVNQVVQVAGLESQIQTETAASETVIQEKQVTDLPLDGRNVIQLVSLAPGMQYTGQQSGQFGAERGSFVQGVGVQSGQTQFSLDGSNANGSMDEGATAIPSVDTIAEFNVQTSNFSAENGRYPLQVMVATKSGTNSYHGSLWEFARNSAFAARNYFENTTPKLVQNQYGAAGGGRILRDKTFFFGSFEALRTRQNQIFNSAVPDPAMLTGDFSSLSKPIIDPTTGQPFPNNQIPADRFDPAAVSFFPYLLQPNAPDGNYHAVAPTKTDSTSGTARIDHVLTSKQHLYGRWVRYDSPLLFYGYSPKVYETNKTVQQSYTLNYVYTMSPNTVFSANGGYQKSNNTFVSPQVGGANLTEQAGIQGFSSPAQQTAGGFPTAGISGYTGFGELWGANGRLWSHSWNGKTSVNLVRGKHLIDIGIQYDTRSVYGNHNSFASHGGFTFNGQYTGNGFADYLLGLTSAAARNYPIAPFGVQHAPYSGIFVEDTYKIARNVTLNLGLRYDHWYNKTLVHGNGATFDPRLGKVIAGVDSNGKVNLDAQPVAPYLAAATAGIWVPANTVGIPGGLFQGNGYFSPRFGVAWSVRNGTVLRGAYGIFTSSFQGNIAASSIIGPPYWSYETPSFSKTSMQKWETAFPQVPNTFSPPGVAAPAWNAKSEKTHEWNVAVEQTLPMASTLTISYVGNHVFDGLSGQSYDDVPAGQYADLQAARPIPQLSSAVLYHNMGDSWYNGLQAKWERRLTNGWTFTGSYAFSKLMVDNLASCVYCTVQPWTPKGYNRGRSSNDITHILTVNSVYDLPVGRGRKYFNDMNRAAGLLLGGWELSGILSYASGAPLSFDVPGATLGNGYDTRPDLAGSLSVPHRSAKQWFNPDALAAPAPYTYGNSGMNILDAPATKGLDAALLKNFVFREGTYLQFRWEAFNAPNYVNLGPPNTSIGESSTGQIFSAGAPRQMQFGLKLIF